MNFGRYIKSLPAILAVAAISACSGDQVSSTSITYPTPLPDSTAIPFLPGIVSSDSLDFNATFSADGKSFYFSRSGKGKWMILMTELKDGAWGKPAPARFNEPQYSQADPFTTGDGTLYYISNRPRNDRDTIPDYDIWRIRLQSDGSWSRPENVEMVNSDSTEYYMSLAANGNLYFASNRAGTLGSHDLYVSRYINGAYTAPENLGPAINSSEMDHDPIISPDEKHLIFTSVDRTDSYGSGDLYYSVRNGDGSWTPAKNMGSKFNTDSYEYCSYLTPDGKYLFYSTSYDVKWISAQYLPWARR